MALTQVDQGLLGTYAQYTGFKNRILNGQMVIDQRNAGASVTPNGTYTLDRWYGDNSQTGKFTVQQNAGSVTPPVGFINYLGVTSSSAYSVLSTDEFRIGQQIEGLNCTDLAWGTANAATVTLSFWVRSSLTGTFGGALGNSANNRSYPFSYTISSANTWEQKSITIAGDQSGTWLTTNGKGINVQFSLGCGSTYSGTANTWAGAFYIQPTGATSVVGTNGATFYITGVQLEKGSTATSFDYRPYGTELQLCQRYYERLEAQSQFWVPNGGYLNYLVLLWRFNVPKRAAVTLSTISGVTATLDSYGQGSVSYSSAAADSGTQYSGRLNFVLPANQSLGTNITLTNTFFQASAEL